MQLLRIRRIRLPRRVREDAVRQYYKEEGKTVWKDAFWIISEFVYVLHNLFLELSSGTRLVHPSRVAVIDVDQCPRFINGRDVFEQFLD